MTRRGGIAVALWGALACSGALGAEPPAPGAVRDYDARLEEIAREVQQIRQELDLLVQDVVEGETGRVLLFLEGPAQDMRDKGVSLSFDGKTVVSRPLSPAELDVLGRGLPLELAELRVTAGDHRVELSPLGGQPGASHTVQAERGKVVSWVAKVGAAGVEWRAE